MTAPRGTRVEGSTCSDCPTPDICGVVPVSYCFRADDAVEKPVLASEAEINAWFRRACTLAGIEVIVYHDGSMGIVNVPSKYLRILDAMHEALVNLGQGASLPELVEPAPKKPKRGACATPATPRTCTCSNGCKSATCDKL